MKYLYLLTIALALLTSCADEKKQEKSIDPAKTDWAFYKLKGNVKSVSEKSFRYLNGMKGGTGNEIASAHDTDLEFNDNGMLVLEKKWNAAIPYEETTFNGKNIPIKKTQYMAGVPAIITENLWDASFKENSSITRRNPDNTQIDRIVQTYKGGRMTEKLTYNMQNNPIDKIGYRYDKSGNLTGEDLYLGVNIVKVKNKYEYDSKNRKIAESSYSEEKLIYKSTYIYSNNNLVKRETIDGKGKVEFIESFVYDGKGNILTHFTHEEPDNSNSEEQFTYDANNNVLTWTIIKKDAPTIKVMYTYDSNNNITATKTSEITGKVIDDRAYKYEYDATGNWTKKTVRLNGQQAFIVERAISYFTDTE